MNTRAALACAAAVIAAAAAGCARAGATAPQPPTARVEHTSAGTSVVLTSLGAQRIALRAAPAVPGAGGITVPYSALVYEPDGAAAVYVVTGTLTYTRFLVQVTTIAGPTVYLGAGALPAGASVVTQGAEELLGVQNGVGEQT